jgi:hypothetical protein
LGAAGVIATVGIGASLALLPVAAGAITYNVIKYNERSKRCNEYGIDNKKNMLIKEEKRLLFKFFK